MAKMTKQPGKLVVEFNLEEIFPIPIGSGIAGNIGAWIVTAVIGELKRKYPEVDVSGMGHTIYGEGKVTIELSKTPQFLS